MIPVDWPPLLTSPEVAKLLRVTRKTVTRWAANGRLPFIRTPGGLIRFYRADIEALLTGDGDEH